jgi:hypothetical protein
METILSNSRRLDIVLLSKKNQQMHEAFSKPHLGAFFAPQKTGLCGGSVPPLCGVTDGHLRRPRPSNPLRTNRQHPKG